jgi:hypothetical protein
MSAAAPRHSQRPLRDIQYLLAALGFVRCARSLSQMELGGKDVCIVCADADLDLAAK